MIKTWDDLYAQWSTNGGKAWSVLWSDIGILQTQVIEQIGRSGNQGRRHAAQESEAWGCAAHILRAGAPTTLLAHAETYGWEMGANQSTRLDALIAGARTVVCVADGKAGQPTRVAGPRGAGC